MQATACINYIRPDWGGTIAIRESICEIYLSRECGQISQEYDQYGSKCNKAVISFYCWAVSIKAATIIETKNHDTKLLSLGRIITTKFKLYENKLYFLECVFAFSFPNCHSFLVIAKE
jgi:hypothetical protein